MLKSALQPAALSGRRVKSDPAIVGGTDTIAGAEAGRAEQLFFSFAFLVLQGAFIGLASSASADDANAASGSDMPHMMAFLLLLLGTAVFARKHLGDLWRGARANLTFFVFPALLVVSTLWSIEPSLTLKRSILAFAVCGVDLYIASRIGLDRLLKHLSTTIFIAVVASVVVAIAVPSVGREIKEGLVGDWRGVFPQKNSFGQVVSVGVFIEMALMIRAHRVLVLGVAKIALLIFLLTMVHSASSILAATLAIVVSVAYMAYRQGPVGLICCALVSVGLAIFVGSLAEADPNLLFGVLDRDPTLTGRTELWLYVERAIQERPVFGWGYEAFWVPDSKNMTYIQNQIQWAAPNSHNGYLEMALGLGFVGVGAMALTGIWALRRIFPLLSRREDLGAMLLIVTLLLLITNLTESFMINASVFVWNTFAIFGLKAGISLAHRPVAKSADFRSISLLDRAKPQEPCYGTKIGLVRSAVERV